jgi:hypothetical protein
MAQTQAEVDAVIRSTVNSVAASIRHNCTPSPEAYAKGGDSLIYAVADWIENPPEFVKDGWAEVARGRSANPATN